MRTFTFFQAFFLLLLNVSVSLEGAPSPQNAFQQLVQGNERYVQNKTEHPNRSTERRQSVTSKQEPFAIIVGCSDSRVAPEIIFDQGIGDLFVIRIAGNVIGPIELASIEYAVDHLNAPLIFVLGHENCGAVKAVISHQTEDIESIADKIEKALKENSVTYSNNALENAVKANVNWVIRELNNNELIRNLVAKQKLILAGGYYLMDSGKVELCCLKGISQ